MCEKYDTVYADIIKHYIKSVEKVMQMKRPTVAILLSTAQNPPKTSASGKDEIRKQS